MATGKPTIRIRLRKPRNPFAVVAKQRKAGRHKDRRKEAARKACRKGEWND